MEALDTLSVSDIFRLTRVFFEPGGDRGDKSADIKRQSPRAKDGAYLRNKRLRSLPAAEVPLQSSTL